MRNSKLLFLLFVSVVLQTKLLATEILGGAIRYQALGNNKYKVIGLLNRNCSSAPLAAPVFNISAGSLSYTLSASRLSITDITPICAKKSPPCNPSNTTTTDGVEQHIYEATVDFSAAPYNQFFTQGQCEVIFSMEACCRSFNLTTITANKFYIEAMLNLCVLGNNLNNSTSLSFPETRIEMCCNLPALYNFNNEDPESDSMAFTLGNPKFSKDSFEQYYSPFSATLPMTPFCLPSGTVNCTALPNAKPPRGITFDQLTGDIIITPSSCNERAAISIQSKEFRKVNGKMELIGFATTELNVAVVVCNANNPPTIPTSNKYTVCEGNKLCFTIQSRDTRALNQTTDDTTKLTWNKGIAGATFTIIDSTAREKSALFCWQTKVGDARDMAYQFTATAIDDFCPNPAKTNKGFLISVKAKAKVNIQYQKQPGNKLVFGAINYSVSSTNYEWSINDTLYKSFHKNDSFVFKDTGVYILKLIVNNLPINCPTVYYDTIRMDGSITLGLQHISSMKVRIYPNPSDDVIHIELPSQHSFTKMNLWSADGKLIYNGLFSNTLNINAYTKGIYLLELINESGSTFAKLIKS